jgi:hypothetical protein
MLGGRLWSVDTKLLSLGKPFLNAIPPPLFFASGMLRSLEVRKFNERDS